MKALTTKLLLTLTAAVTLSFAQPARADYIVTLVQSGSSVVAHGSGAFNLMGLLAGGSFGVLAGVVPNNGDITVASSNNVTVWTGFSGPSGFGPSGAITFASSNSGDSVTIIGGAFDNGLYLPTGYVSGTVLSDRSTYNNATFASLGVTPGTYVWRWGTLSNQSFTLKIGAAAVPDGGSTVSLLGCALLGLAALRRKLGC